MEMNEDEFLEELLALRRETWELANPSTEINGLFSTTTWQFNGLDSPTPPPSSSILPTNSFSSIEPTISLDCSSFPDFYVNSSTPLIPTQTTSPYPVQAQPQAQCQVFSSIVEGDSKDEGLDHAQATCKDENVGLCMDKSSCSSGSKTKIKKIEGQPSKNLMAERRRRKRLNDRLSMLRSVVPKISKLDRTSILGDTIDYMKELKEKINNLQQEIDVGSNQLSPMSIFKDVKSNEGSARNSPKFEVERSNSDTQVQICCAGKPGLLLSTITALESLGLQIQQCVISSFNDFSLRASCSEEMEQRTLASSEEIKQALFRNAGYGGKCL